MFDPAIPRTDTEMRSAEMRDQFNALKAIADDLQTQINALSGGGVAGNNREIQFNNAGTLAGSPGLKFYDSGSAERSLEVSVPTGTASLIVDDNGGGDIQSKLNLTGNNASMAISYLDLPQEVLIRNDGAGGVTVLPSVKTGNPGSGAGRWQLGQLQAGAVAVDAGRYLEASIDGAVVKLVVAV